MNDASAVGLSPRSVVKYQTFLHAIFERAVIDRRRRSPEKFDALLAEIPDAFRLMVLVAIETGVRWGELTALRPVEHTLANGKRDDDLPLATSTGAPISRNTLPTRRPASDRKVAAWLQDTAEAPAEIGEFDLAIDWARRALDVGPGHQALKAGEYWCTCSPSTVRSSWSRRGWRCSGAGRHPAPLRTCIGMRARRGRSTAMRWCSGSRSARVMWCCSHCCRSRTCSVRGSWPIPWAWMTTAPGVA